MRFKCRLIWDPYLGEVLLMSHHIALSITVHCFRDVKAISTQGTRVNLAVLNGIAKNNEIKLQKYNQNCLWGTSRQHWSLGLYFLRILREDLQKLNNRRASRMELFPIGREGSQPILLCFVLTRFYAAVGY